MKEKTITITIKGQLLKQLIKEATKLGFDHEVRQHIRNILEEHLKNSKGGNK